LREILCILATRAPASHIGIERIPIAGAQMRKRFSRLSRGPLSGSNNQAPPCRRELSVHHLSPEIASAPGMRSVSTSLSLRSRPVSNASTLCTLNEGMNVRSYMSAIFFFVLQSAAYGTAATSSIRIGPLDPDSGVIAGCVVRPRSTSWASFLDRGAGL
jgi:hypothetical protein